jgi:hypothetical protein
MLAGQHPQQLSLRLFRTTSTPRLYAFVLSKRFSPLIWADACHPEPEQNVLLANIG